MGLVSESAEPNDKIYVLAGGQVLYVLRQEGDCFRFMGECYIHGLMDGEALEKLKSGTAQVYTVRIK
jgi:hypothetical protein